MAINVEYIALLLVSLISLIGGINWLITAINSWANNNEETPDLLQKNMKFPVGLSNVIYIVVFVCTLLVFLMVIFPGFLKNMFTKVKDTAEGAVKKVTGK